MEYKDIRENLEEMMNDNYKDFIKALVSIEKGVNDEKVLEEVYVLYMNNDTTGLLSDDFDYMIDDMKEQGKIDKKKKQSIKVLLHQFFVSRYSPIVLAIKVIRIKRVLSSINYTAFKEIN